MLLSQSPDDRVMIFLDVANLSRAVEGQLAERHRIDWFRLAKHLAGPRRLVGAYVFDRAPDGEYGNPKKRFHDHLRYSGFRIVTRPHRPEDRGFQGEINVAIATELLSACHMDLLDVAVVVTGDRNLAPAMEHASRMGKIVEVACMADQLPPDLRKAADRVQQVDDFPILELMPDAPSSEFVGADEEGDGTRRSPREEATATAAREVVA